MLTSVVFVIVFILMVQILLLLVILSSHLTSNAVSILHRIFVKCGTLRFVPVILVSYI